MQEKKKRKQAVAINLGNNSMMYTLWELSCYIFALRPNRFLFLCREGMEKENNIVCLFRRRRRRRKAELLFSLTT
jgi:hypothetical protein